MSLDNIELPPIVLQGLFKHSLVFLEKEEKSVDGSASKEFSTLGNNRKHIVIMVADANTLYLPDEQLNFLLGILAACDLTMEDVAILNIKKNKSVTYKTVSDELSPEKLFLFGVKPAEIGLPLDFPNYQVQRYNNQTYLSAPLLSKFQDDKAEKTRLWNCLKQIFGI